MNRFVLPIFLGAFLLFQVQPLIGKCLLPWFGGAPAVWTTCLLFFQSLLLAGYWYADVLTHRLAPRAQKATHFGLLAASLALLAGGWLAWGTPLLPGAGWRPTSPDLPILHILLLLTVTVGLPYLALSTTSPLLQAWHSRAYPDRSPYRLYTLSNAGSLLALLSYPVLVEPRLDLRAQGLAWAAAYVLFLAACAYCTAKLPTAAATTRPDAATEAEAVPRAMRTRQWLVWVALAAVGSLTLLAVTNQICQQVAVIPFLWVLPLALYLLSFVICFDHPRWYARWLFLPALVVLLFLCADLLMKHALPSSLHQIKLYGATMFVGCMVCHGELAALKPAPQRLTSFYLAVAVGGALGGLFVAVLAPLAFRGFWELPIALVGCAVVALAATSRAWSGHGLPGRLAPWALAALVALGATGIKRPQYPLRKLLVTRNFYGLLTVNDQLPDDPQWRHHTLVHGAILHGTQFVAPDKRRLPVSYYGEHAGLGLALLKHPRRRAGQPLRVGVIGLGAGCMAVYGRRGDYLRFYEINPEVARIARNPAYFTYLQDCPAQVDIVLGDARLAMERELAIRPQQFDALVLDAFSGDVIPSHLLTREAFALYQAHLRQPGGIIVANISNIALDLRPVVWALADDLGLRCAMVDTPAEGDVYADAHWAILSPDPTFVESPAIAEASTPRDPAVRPLLWTDQYNSLFQLLRR